MHYKTGILVVQYFHEKRHGNFGDGHEVLVTRLDGDGLVRLLSFGKHSGDLLGNHGNVDGLRRLTGGFIFE